MNKRKNLYTNILFVFLFMGIFQPLSFGKNKVKNQIKKFGTIELVFINTKLIKSMKEKKIKNHFYLGKYEITQKQYRDLTGKDPCRLLKLFCGDNQPVHHVDWYDAIEFCNLLSKKNNLTPYYKIQKEKKDNKNMFPFDSKRWLIEINENGNGFRLPSEAEWEYAYRAGTVSRFFWGKNQSKRYLNRYTVYLFNSGYNRYRYGVFWDTRKHKTRPVGSKKANPWGLYDMAGNVAEWCWDPFYPKLDIQKNGFYKARVVRGGSYLDSRISLTATYREASPPNNGSKTFGFRVALPVQATNQDPI